MHRSAKPHAPAAPQRRATPAFTLVELLVVIGIIALLMGMLIPTVAGTRRQSRSLQCASNIRQLCIGIFGYAAENKNRFPSNLPTPSPGTYWDLATNAAGYVSTDGPTKNSVFTCPDDLEGARRSYSMNTWASSAPNTDIVNLTPKRGIYWGPTPREGSRIILITESWSHMNFLDGRESNHVIGYRGITAGQRFGGGTGIAPPVDFGIFGKANSELAFARHRPRNSPASGTQPIGAVNIGYLDGHVALKTHGDLVDPETGKSTLDSLWSSWDIENP